MWLGPIELVIFGHMNEDDINVFPDIMTIAKPLAC